MRDHMKSAIALLILLPLPVLYGCGEDPTGVIEPFDNPGARATPMLEVYPDLVVLAPGQSLQLNARLEQRGPDLEPPEFQVSWSSSAPEIVAVSADGEITALREGEASIFAKHGPWAGEGGVIVSGDTEIFGHVGGW
jgi:hypothetical protein